MVKKILNFYKFQYQLFLYNLYCTEQIDLDLTLKF